MDYNIACALHYASKCEGFLVRDEYFTSEEFLKINESVDEAQDIKKGVSRQEEVKKGNKKAKSYDYGLITNQVNKVDPKAYRSENWIKS
jgi:hypothetical protein